MVFGFGFQPEAISYNDGPGGDEDGAAHLRDLAGPALPSSGQM